MTQYNKTIAECESKVHCHHLVTIFLNGMTLIIKSPKLGRKNLTALLTYSQKMINFVLILG